MINCWEYTECGREQGGIQAEKLGVCPASVFKSSNGENHGVNGGRICWSIDKTPCKGEDNDLKKCIKCNFYGEVKKKEINNFKLVNPDKKVKYKKGTLTINVGEILCYGTVATFEKQFADEIVANKKVKVKLNFKKTKKIDTSALGMLLVLKQEFEVREDTCICLTNISDDVLTVIDRCNFRRLFKTGDC